MPIRLEPMRHEDYVSAGPDIRAGLDASSLWGEKSIISPSVFGSAENTSPTERPVGIDHTRGYIHLRVPVLNPATSLKGDLFAKIVGVERKFVKDVQDAKVCYDPASDSYVVAEDVEDASSVLWGGHVFRKLVSEFSIEDAIRNELSVAFGEYAKKIPVCSGIEFHRGGSGLPAAGDWKIVPKDPDEWDYSTFADFIGKQVFHTQNSRLSYLLNLQDHKERLDAMIMSDVMVVPMGMRPPIDQRHDPLTHSYNTVIAANNNLSMCMASVYDATVFGQYYRNLCNAVENLLVTQPAHHDLRRPILERLKGKKGHIRGKMLAKRVDYSGRSVITIDPYLSLRKVKIPKDMAPKLYRSHILEDMANPTPSDWIGVEKQDKCLKRLEESGILEKVPVVIGRQPTLHKPSMRAFKPELTEERSIRINPLCVTGFNADFDGDQMWTRVPVSSTAVVEAKELMSIEQNLYYPKNGECSVMPRQEIIYGLNVCTRSNLQKGASTKTYIDSEELFEDLFGQCIGVEDTVTFNGMTDCAGRVAFAACLPKYVLDKFGVQEITSRSITQYVETMLERSAEDTIDSIDMMVTLGFKISYLYPPTLNLLDAEDISYAENMQQFHKDIEEITTLYERGLEEQEAFDAAYDQSFRQVEDVVKSTVFEKLGAESGFVRLSESGARGSKSNMVQMYGYKGRIQKTTHESFRAVIEHSYTEQLTPLEHFVTAYGGRQGLIDKSLHTADTGYASRKMWHAASPYVIVDEDCGTTEGIEIKKSDIAMFTNISSVIDDVFKKIITGRYLAGSNEYVTAAKAEELCASRDAVIIRSVITCKNPCCKKCYGDDPSTHRAAAIGLPIGLIAAQSIGEPGTQLSMDSFKKGGVASKSCVTSAFDRLSAYIECSRLSDNKRFNSYDPVAWATGTVKERMFTDGTKRVSIEGSGRSIRLPVDAVMRKEVKQGEGMCVERGDYDINELVEYAGIGAAQTYFIHTLYHIYKDECEISMKHFEVLAASMTMHMVVSTDREDLYPGQYHDTIHMLQGDLSNTIYTTRMLGVKRVQPARPQLMSRVLLEHVGSGLATSLVLGLDDKLIYPLNRIVLGLPIDCGGADEFLEERKI